MAAPSNIRINPFIGDGGTTNYVDFTEVHIIPAVSPFVVRLNEVPQKKDPSNMKVVYVNETTGAPTTTALTEVAATPGAGEFRPDYSTNADGDEDWNTGLIEFSSADAGKSIQVSYTGMGTLAGVKNNRFPAWWLDRGDGSDGDFRPTGNTTISGYKKYNSLYIPSDVVVKVDGFVFIKVLGAVVINGILSAENEGAPAGARGATSGGNGYAGGDGYGCGAGGGGLSADNFSGGAGGGSKYFYRGLLVDMEDEYFIRDLNTGNLAEYRGAGAGGGACTSNWWRGASGNGGGCIVIVSSEVSILGTLSAKGGDGTASDGYGSGGGGGCVVVIANTISGAAKIDVSGGRSGNNGGDGRKFIKEIGVM